MKHCSRCKHNKPRSEFSNKCTTKDGLDPWCKACKKEYASGYYQAHKATIMARSAVRSKTHKDTPESRASKKRRDRRYYLNHKEERHQYLRHRRSAKRASRTEPYKDTDIFKRDAWMCRLCGGTIVTRDRTQPHGPTIDHIVPLEVGGPDTPTNVRTAHRICNIKRGLGPFKVIQMERDGKKNIETFDGNYETIELAEASGYTVTLV